MWDDKLESSLKLEVAHNWLIIQLAMLQSRVGVIQTWRIFSSNQTNLFHWQQWSWNICHTLKPNFYVNTVPTCRFMNISAAKKSEPEKVDINPDMKPGPEYDEVN